VARRKRTVGSAGIAALRESEARFRSLTHLSSDWYWEQDAGYRFTRIEGRNISPHAPSLVGQRRWETHLEIEGGWDQHRALLEARKPFFNVLMWRAHAGSHRFIQVSGEPVFDADGSFRGYRGVGRDITEQKRAEQLLRLEHQVASALSESASADAGIEAVLHAMCETESWECGRYFEHDEARGEACYRGGWSIRNPVLEAFLAGSRGQCFRPGYGLVGKVLQTGEPIWSSDADRDQRVEARLQLAEAGLRGAFVFAVTAEGRRLGALAFSSRELREPDQRLLQASRVIGAQVGQFLQRMRAQDALRESEARFRSLTQMSSDFYWETDPNHVFTQLVDGSASRGGRSIVGHTAWDFPSVSPSDEAWAELRATIDAHRPFRNFEIGRRKNDGSVRHLSVSGEPRFAPDGRFLGYRGVGRDITAVVRAREHISSLAYSDPLTGLANRVSLAPAFEQAIERSRRRQGRLAALFIDLDGFKQVNDAFGHESGDRFLAEIGRRLRAGLRASDLVARLGGDEFFAVLEDVQERAQVEAVARKLLVEIARPVDLGQGITAQATGSIGVSLFPDDAPDVATLMKYADRAMYGAKQAGKNGLRFHAAA
jgi:diguanylate cyclase (GGDEF)-like protein/PAS domain S-box-containing protein